MIDQPSWVQPLSTSDLPAIQPELLHPEPATAAKPAPRLIIANRCPICQARRDGFKAKLLNIPWFERRDPRVRITASGRATSLSSRQVDAYREGFSAAWSFKQAGYWLWAFDHDHDWIVARGPGEAIATWCEEVGESPLDYTNTLCEPVSIADLKRLRFIDGDEGYLSIPPERQTLNWPFIDQLAEEIAVNRRTGPFWFAGTEF